MYYDGAGGSRVWWQTGVCGDALPSTLRRMAEGTQPDGEEDEGGAFPEPPPEDFAPDPPTDGPPPPKVTPLRLIVWVLGGLFLIAPITIVPLLLMAGGARDAQRPAPSEWRAFTAPAPEPWQAELPGQPTVIPNRLPGTVVTEVRLATETGGYMVKSQTLPNDVLPGASRDELLDAWEASLAEGAPPDKRREVRRTTGVLDGRHARIVDFELVPAPNQRLAARGWFVADGRRLYVFSVLRLPGGIDDADSERFIRSVRLPR